MATKIEVDGQKILGIGKGYDVEVTEWPQIDGQPVHKSLCYYDGTSIVKLKTKATLDSEQAIMDIDKINISDRGLEDLIDVLILNGTIKIDDLPQELQDNYTTKKDLRDKII